MLPKMVLGNTLHLLEKKVLSEAKNIVVAFQQLFPTWQAQSQLLKTALEYL